MSQSVSRHLTNFLASHGHGVVSYRSPYLHTMSTLIAVCVLCRGPKRVWRARCLLNRLRPHPLKRAGYIVHPCIARRGRCVYGPGIRRSEQTFFWLRGDNGRSRRAEYGQRSGVRAGRWRQRAVGAWRNPAVEERSGRVAGPGSLWMRLGII